MADWTSVAIALLAGTGSACLALLLVRNIPGRSARAPVRRAAPPAVEPVVLLFRDRKLIDATGSARTLLDALPGDRDWTRLWVWLGQRFESPQRVLDMAAAEGSAVLCGTALQGGRGVAALRLRAEDLGTGLVRLEIIDPALEHAGITVNSHSLAAMEDELVVLRESVDHAPVLIWRENREGTVTWANAAYLREIEKQNPEEVRWPLPRLICLPDDAGAVRRAEIELDGTTHWFDCHMQSSDEHRTVFAVPADNAARAERSLREFVQTLTKTFADLHIGLAIFDQERRLQLFNPAMIDLTRLPVGFLTARPTLFALLDALRELRMVPEPKDYASWRRTIATLEAGAASGHHIETWSLPGGETYRVTGRPHPDGAIAFLVEDITSEISLSRRFRAELSLAAEVMDALEAAVAIFDADGRLISSNRLFDAMWGADAASTLRGYDEIWHRKAGDSPGYRAMRAALAMTGSESRRSGAIAGPERDLLTWRVCPLSGGRRMVKFTRPPAAGAPAIGAEMPRPSASARAPDDTPIPSVPTRSAGTA